MTQGVDDGVNKGDSLATGYYKVIEFCSQAVLRFIHKDFLLTEVILEKKNTVLRKMFPKEPMWDGISDKKLTHPSTNLTCYLW